jgi:hypothetical protein
MSDLLLLTAEQAAEVTTPQPYEDVLNALNPVAFTSPYETTYTHYVGIGVLSDPDGIYAALWPFLSTCPTIDQASVADLMPLPQEPG